MGRALKYEYGWLINVEGGWTKERKYNIRDLPEGKKKKKKKSPGKREEMGIHVLGRGVLFPWDVGPSDSVFLAPIWSPLIPKQAITLSEPNFWTHSLQIHCNGSAGPRSRPSLGLIRKPWPYNWRRLWESCSCNGLLR